MSIVSGNDAFQLSLNSGKFTSEIIALNAITLLKILVVT